MYTAQELAAIFGLEPDALSLLLSFAGTVSAVIGAFGLLVAVKNYIGVRRGRDFAAVLAIQKTVREEFNSAMAVADPLDEKKFCRLVLHYFDALEIAALLINKKILDPVSRRFESEWLAGETKKLFGHTGLTGKVFRDAREGGAYTELVRFHDRYHREKWFAKWFAKLRAAVSSQKSVALPRHAETEAEPEHGPALESFQTHGNLAKSRDLG